MNKGDKVVCIKSNTHELTSSFKERFRLNDDCIKFFIEGKVYNVEYDDADKSCFIECDANFTMEDGYDGLRFYFEIKFDFEKDRYFYDYFMTLSEWREKQIESILND
jgi:hypothetical protein